MAFIVHSLREFEELRIVAGFGYFSADLGPTRVRSAKAQPRKERCQKGGAQTQRLNVVKMM
jgi:hypothetical protein